MGSKESRRLLSLGTLTAISIDIHNFPEGISVFLGTVGDPHIGLVLAVAIAAHNIPEGIAVAVPIYAATKNRMTAFWYTLLSGVAEPIGAVFAFLILWRFLDDRMMSVIYGLIAGIMTFVSFDELLPCCFENRKGHTAIAGITVGIAMMAFSLRWLA